MSIFPSDSDYQRTADETLAGLQQKLDTCLDVLDWETHGDILYIYFEDGEKVVINKQPPLHQLWFASKEVGKQFAWTGKEWDDVRGGGTLNTALKQLLQRKGIDTW
ncbi:MAG: iron donor protein CyaY [Pseudomonadota bacterium]